MTRMRKHMIMNKMNGLLTKKKIFLIILLILLGFIAWYTYKYNTIHNINYKLIHETELDNNYSKEKGKLMWYSNGDVLFDAWDGPSPKYYDGIKLNYNNYIYIVTLNYELADFSYTYTKSKDKKLSIFPNQFVGFAILKASESGKSHLYKIKKMDIDYDYYTPENSIVYINS